MQQAVQLQALSLCAPVCKALPNLSSRIALAMMAHGGAMTLPVRVHKVQQREESL